MKLTLAGSVSLIALLAGSAAWAGPVLDQSQYQFNIGIPFTNTFTPETNYPLGQSFTAGISGLLNYITVASNGSIASPGTLTVEILTGGGTGGTDLGSVTESYAAHNPYDPSDNAFWLDLNVASLGIDVTAGSQYTFLITNVTGSDFPDRGVLANELNPYAGGQAYAAAYGNVPSWDLVFQTYVGQSNGAVPDSGSTCALLVLAAAAMAGFGCKFRRA